MELEMNNQVEQIKYPFSYKGNIVLLILFLFIWPPLGFLLLLFNTEVHVHGETSYLKYRGSTGWLIFWSIVLFPLAIILAAIRGFDIITVKDQ